MTRISDHFTASKSSSWGKSVKFGDFAANVEKKLEICHIDISWLLKHFYPKGQRFKGQGQGQLGYKGHTAIKALIQYSEVTEGLFWF